MNPLKLDTMNNYLFWILFLSLWAIVPLMIIKGKTDETPKSSIPKAKEDFVLILLNVDILSPIKF